MNRRLLGQWGEEQSANYLRRKRFSITALNYTTRFGEIDVIAEKGKFVVFVEVKLRKSDGFARAAEFVDANKRRRLISAASMWLAENDTGKQPRFDVIEIYAPEGTDTAKPVINHIVNAFGDDGAN